MKRFTLIAMSLALNIAAQAQTPTIEIPNSLPRDQFPGALERQFIEIYELQKDSIERVESYNTRKITVMSIVANTGKPRCVDGYLITVYTFMNWSDSPGRYYYKYFFLSGTGRTYQVTANPVLAEGSNVDLSSEASIVLNYSPDGTCSFFGVEVSSAEAEASRTKGVYVSLFNWDDDAHAFTNILTVPLRRSSLAEDPQEWQFSFDKSGGVLPDIIMGGANSHRYRWNGVTYEKL